MSERRRKPIQSRPRQEEPTIALGARLVALDVLIDVRERDAYASLALGKRLTASSALSPRDKRLATELVYGTLENQIRIDHMLDFFLEKKDVEPLVRDILRMGAFQLFFLDRVPGSAAVNEAVKLTRAKGREAFTGLVNAVLRGMTRDINRVTYPDPEQEPARFLSLKHSLPLWIAERLIEAYGHAQAIQIAQYRDPDATVTVRPNLERTTIEAFEAYLRRRGFAFEPGSVPGAYRISRPGDLTREAEYRRGHFCIQGESSMLAALAVGVKPGLTVLDACAAPGGKTALLAEGMRGSGRVHAWDLHEHRVELLRAMATRLHLDNVRPAQRDAAIFRQEMEGAIDAVLVDAPCSGLGVITGKPDIKYRQSAEALASLIETQAQILDACCRYVKPGGALVYATCSILPEENGNQIDAFLARHPEFAPQGLAEHLPGRFRDRIVDNRLQLLAHQDGMDGFFIARMVRV
ncbi:MAG: 16S rRNA (cytosine(967)-C(5))-methyltransferase RsmB [Clostridia bacterium]|nr:16S rRNA (cytosine(967)-C(5))-methyltransferase RsmB [Clostridia bacterium]